MLQRGPEAESRWGLRAKPPEARRMLRHEANNTYGRLVVYSSPDLDLSPLLLDLDLDLAVYSASPLTSPRRIKL